MIKITYPVCEHFVDFKLSLIHTRTERAHQANDVVLAHFVDHSDPKFVDIPQSKAIQFKKGPLVQAVQFAEFLKLDPASSETSLFRSHDLCIHMKINQK